VPELRGFDFPDGLYYLIEHDMWARYESDGRVTAGITALGVHMAGELYAYMPKAVGTAVERERAFGVVEMSKAIRSVRSPVSGRVVSVNAAARARPALINTDPYGEGWLAQLEPNDWSQDRKGLVTGAALTAAMLAYMDLNEIS
jgi:glycine cleavage system H protein